jgi:hypothetical protein
MASVTKTFRLGSTPAVKVYLPFYHRLFGIEELMMEALHLTPKKKKKRRKKRTSAAGLRDHTLSAFLHKRAVGKIRGWMDG